MCNSEQVDNGDNPELQKQKVKESADKKLEELKTRILELFPNLSHGFHIISAFGLLIDEVNDLAERENADLIMTSTR